MLREINLGDKNPMYGRRHSEETRVKLSAARKGKKHTPETKAMLREINLGDKNPNSGRVHSEEERDLLRARRRSEEGKAQIRATKLKQRRLNEAEMAQAQAVYQQLAIVDPRRELVALYFGFGIYQQHSTRQIAGMFGLKRDWAQRNFRLIRSGEPPANVPSELEIPDKCRWPIFQGVDCLNNSQLIRLAQVLPQLDPLEFQIAVRLFGLAGHPVESTSEINHQLFQSAPWGEQKIAGLKRQLELHVNGRA